MQAFSVKQADLTLELNFEKTAFSLLGTTWQRVMQSLHARLERYGVTPRDISIGQVGPIGDRYMTFLMPRINGGVKLNVSKVEIGLNNALAVTFEDLRHIVSSVVESLREADEAFRFANLVASYNVHGELTGSNAAAFIGSFVRARPEGLGPDTGGAAGFYYGSEASRLHLAVILDGSVLVPDGLYMRLTTSFDGRRVDLNSVLETGRAEFRKTFVALGLRPDGIDLGEGG